MPAIQRTRVRPPAEPDASGLGMLVVLTSLLAVTVAFVATGGGLIDAVGQLGPAGWFAPGAAASPRASGAPSPTPSAGPSTLASSPAAASTPPSATPAVTPTPTPGARAPITVNLLAGRDPRTVFASEVTDLLCAAAGVQMAAELVTGHVDRSAATQRRIHDLEVAATTRADSHNGGVGPLGMAATMTKLTGVRYELRIATTRTGALRDAAATLRRTHRPILLLAWRGAHTWVVTGFRASADPAVFGDASITGMYVLDPWYPRVSRIWGRSDPPNAFQDAKEMVRNYLPWKRPEGHYVGRDGRFLYLAPAEA